MTDMVGRNRMILEFLNSVRYSRSRNLWDRMQLEDFHFARLDLGHVLFPECDDLTSMSALSAVVVLQLSHIHCL